VTKVLANRMKYVLQEVINSSQCAFVPGSLITGNFLLAFEIFHHMRTSRRSNKKPMSLKIDMMEAYDRVEWSFLLVSMLRLGLETNWVDLL
jgi:hypothetical protein